VANVKVDVDAYKAYVREIKVKTRTACRHVLNDMARDAGLLARAHEPSNMPKNHIVWDVSPAIGPEVKAVGAPAAYDGHPKDPLTFSGTFRHPIFASQNIPRNRWNWADQKTRPFIEEAAEEISKDAELVMEAGLQRVFDET
jgi:hypothetical protein